VHFIAWTTTPWTLPANLALCVGPKIEYRVVRDRATNAVLVLAAARLSAYYKKEAEYEVIRSIQGVELEGLRYEPLLPYFEGHSNGFVVLADDFVTTEDGTGVVHLAPAYGEDDFRVCGRAGIALVDPLDGEARFTNA